MLSTSNLAGRWSIAFLLYVAAGMTALVSTVLVPALPAISADFGSHANSDLLAQSLMAMPAITIIVGGLIVAQLTRRFGNRRTLTWGLVIYGLAGTSGLVAPDLTTLFAARLITGLAGGIVAPVALAVLISSTEGAARNRALGFSSAASAALAMIVIMLSSLLVELFGWRSAFAIYTLAFVLAPIAAFGVSDAGPVAQQDKPSTSLSAVYRNGHLIALLGLIGVALFTPVTLGPFRLREIGVDDASVRGMLLATPALASTISALSYGRIRLLASAWTVLATSLGLIATGFLLAAIIHTPAGIALAFTVFGIGAGTSVAAIRDILFATNGPDIRTLIAGWTVATLYAAQMSTPFALAPFQGGFGPGAAFLAFSGIFGALAAGVVAVAIWIAARRPRITELRP